MIMRWMSYVMLGFVLTGCSTSSLITPYPEQIQPAQKELAAQQYQLAEAIFMPRLHSNDWQLYALELGRVQQLSGQYQESIATFAAVINAVEKQLLSPKVQGSVVLATGGSLFTNDNALPYQLKGYEIILLYQYQALNYLMTNDLQDALVAFRRANELQDYLESLHQKEIAQAQAQVQQKGLDIKDININQQAALQSTFTAAAKIKSAFQNPLAYFLASFAFDAGGDINDAVVAMQKVLETAPDNTFVQVELLQLLQKRGDSEADINQYLKLFQMQKIPVIPPQSGQIVIMLEAGFIPPMQQKSFLIPMANLDTAQKFVFPVYAAQVAEPDSWQVSLDHQALPDLQPLLNLEPLAAKELSEDYPLIFMRQAMRIATNAGMVAAAEQSASQDDNNNGSNAQAAALIGGLAMLYSHYMERADLRSWLLLPANIFVAVYTVPAGEHQLVINAMQKQEVSVKINAGQTILIWVNAQGTMLSSRSSAF